MLHRPTDHEVATLWRERACQRRPGANRRGLRGIGGGGAAAPFTPAAWTTDLWLRADDVTTGATMTWNDKSGNGRSPTQGSAASQPTVTTRAGQAVLSFDGGDYLQKAYGVTLSQPHTMYVVAELTSTAGSQLIVDGDDATNRYRLFLATNNWNASANASAAITTAASLGIHAFCVVFNGASSALYVDDFGNAAATGTLNGAPDGITIGASSSLGAFMTGYVWEIVLAVGAHDATERGKFRDYATRYTGL